MTSAVGPATSARGRAAPPFLLSIDLSAGRVSVHGDLDRRNAPRLLDAVTVLESSPAPCWSIDVSAVSFCDAVGLRALLEGQRFAHAAGRSFRLARPGPWLCRLLSLVGLDAAGSPPVPLRPAR